MTGRACVSFCLYVFAFSWPLAAHAELSEKASSLPTAASTVTTEPSRQPLSLKPLEGVDDDELIRWAVRLRDEIPALFQGAKGVLVAEPVKDLQGEAVGIQRGDIILKYGGNDVNSIRDFVDSIEAKKQEPSVEMVYLRNAKSSIAVLKSGRVGVDLREIDADILYMDRLLREGLKAYKSSDYSTAAKQWEMGLTKAKILGKKYQAGWFLRHLGAASRNLGQPDKAEANYLEALKVHREMKDRSEEALTLNNLAFLYDKQGSPDKSVHTYRLASEAFRDAGDKVNEALAIRWRATILQKLDRHDEAIELFKVALNIYRETKNAAEEANTLEIIAASYFERKNGEAVKWLETALPLRIEMGDQEKLTETHMLLGMSYTLLEQPEKALVHLEAALAAKQYISNDILPDLLILKTFALYSLHRYTEAYDFAKGNVEELRSSKNQLEFLMVSTVGMVALKLGYYKEAAERGEAVLGWYKNVLPTLNETTKKAAKKYEKYAAAFLPEVYSRMGRHEEALALAERALLRARETGDTKAEAEALRNLAIVYKESARYEDAFRSLNQALELSLSVGDTTAELEGFYEMASMYEAIGVSDKAREIGEKALSLAREKGDQLCIARAMDTLGVSLTNLGQPDRAVLLHEESQRIYRALKNLDGEGSSLWGLGHAYEAMGSNHDSLRCYEAALRIERLTRNQRQEGVLLRNLASIFSQRGDVEKAESYLKQALEIAERNHDRGDIACIVLDQGVLTNVMGHGDKALEKYQQALAMFRELKNRSNEARTLGNIGAVYVNLGQYDSALRTLENSLVISREMKDKTSELVRLGDIAVLFYQLGKYDMALNYTRQSLSIAREVKARTREEWLLTAMGCIQTRLGRHKEAIDYLHQGLTISRDVKDRSGEGMALIALGEEHNETGQYEKALEYSHQGVSIARAMKDPRSECDAMITAGKSLRALGRNGEAVQLYMEASAIADEVKSPEMQWTSLHGLSASLAKLERTEAAIFFGKKAVNSIQGQRLVAAGMDKDLRKGFMTRERTEAYRHLADLLIDRGRLPEAQQVLAMLKEEEYFDFIRGDVTRGEVRSTTATLTPTEEDLEKRYQEIHGNLAALGREYSSLKLREQIGLTDEEKTRLARLETDLKAARLAFVKYLDELQTAFENEGGKRLVELGKKNLADVQALSGTLRELGNGAVLVHYLVTADKLRIILTTPAVQITREHVISEKELNRRIAAYRKILTKPNADPLPKAQDLYRVVLGPIAEDLKQAGAKTLMLSLDGTLRYLPLAALHDGSHYIAESFRIVLFTEAARDKIKDAPVPKWTAAGLGVSEAVGGFDALPAVKDELSGIVRIDAKQGRGVLQGEMRIDGEFTAAAFKQALSKGYPVFHIASHFEFQPGKETDSYLLLGDGNKVSLAAFALEGYDFSAVELLTLSACNTAVGAARADGREVEGLGVTAQRRGAKGVLATLWPVADQSTGLFMQQFYRIRQENPGMTKAEALQKAQMKFIEREPETVGKLAALSSDPESTPDYGHPYYWAPFILMGNWR